MSKFRHHSAPVAFGSINIRKLMIDVGVPEKISSNFEMADYYLKARNIELKGGIQERLIYAIKDATKEYNRNKKHKKKYVQDAEPPKKRENNQNQRNLSLRK